VTAATIALLGALLPATGSLAATAPTDSTGRQALASGTTSAGATAIATGYQHTCALLAGGSVDCWGGNFNGQLGNGTTTDSSTPVAVAGVGLAASAATITAISAGGLIGYTCAATTDGAAWCWGGNGSGQLGDGTTTERDQAVRVTAI
jgi:alpha-tubulin suppressor-like RCC1 family protein